MQIHPAAPSPSPTLAAPSSRQSPAYATDGRTTFGSIVSILKDGTDGPAFSIGQEQTDIGRTEGEIVLRDDPYLSPRHARLTHRPGGIALRDLESANGVYIKLREPALLSHGDMIHIGQQVLRFEVVDDTEAPIGPAMINGTMCFGTPEVARFARLVQYTTEGISRDIYTLFRDETVMGREHGDIVFTDDPFLSRRHAAIVVDRASKRYVMRDLGSSNGSAVRLRGEFVLRNGDQFRLGRHLFRYDAAKSTIDVSNAMSARGVR